MSHLFLITGASKGLGLSMSIAAIAQGHSVIGFSRSQPSPGRALDHVRFRFHQLDLSDLNGAIEVFEAALRSTDLSSHQGIHLIQNAASVEPIGNVIGHDPKVLAKSLAANLVTPMALTSCFVRRVDGTQTLKSLTTVTSGLATSPLAGTSAYAAAKAGLRMQTLSLALELAHRHDWRVHSFSPGVMDTKMQETLRGSKDRDFSEAERFRKMKATGALRQADDVGSAWIRALLSDEWSRHVEIRVSDLI